MYIPDIFAENVFSDEVMKSSLKKEVYESLRRTIDEGASLDDSLAQPVADAMKNWAIQKGATHYTHWFQPMTGITAEKHESFISPASGGGAIMEFSGKELIKGEPDASSFPNGGIRATFEARGYTAWDPSSFAFVKDNTLYIPTAFCSYSGEALDKKTPLIRSTEALNRQALRVLRLLGTEDVAKVRVTVGAEQEYFLLDKEVWRKRRDLVYTGRTLFGSRSPKGQELGDHYFGAIKPRVKNFMADLDRELWKLGIFAKTEHNEVAPSQHELAPVFSEVNLATDNNQLTMELMKKIADRHGLVCLLAEKPFKCVNGSGKHNNWSVSTDTGVNLLDPGETPLENLQFLLFLAAVIRAADDYQELLRASVASAGNDHRLGANEAPPAVLSVYLGDDLSAALLALENHETYTRNKKLMALGASILPALPKDSTDRNRTSPLAFTGNKFEFRMVGSSASIADCNVAINASVAESLSAFADILEKADDIHEAIHNIVVDTLKKHKRIIFNGNNYSPEWIEEAKKRGLNNLPSTPDAIKASGEEKNVKLYEKHGIMSATEFAARRQVAYENYARIINIEALTMLDMSLKQIYPAINEYIVKLSASASAKKSIGVNADTDIQLAIKLSELNDGVFEESEKLEKLLSESKLFDDAEKLAFFMKDEVLTVMEKLRYYADEEEKITSETCWPYPTYGKLLFSLR